MIDESMDTEQMQKEPQPWEFRSKPSWQRLIIMLGGVTVNFILAALIYILLAFVYGNVDVDAKTLRGGYLISNPVLEKIGIKTGDNILEIDGSEVVYASEVLTKIITAIGITIERNGQAQNLEFPIDFLGQLSSSISQGFIELRVPFIFEKPVEGSINSDVDIQSGDILVSIDGKPTQFIDQSGPLLNAKNGKTVNIEISRGGAFLERQVQVNNEGKLGFSLKSSRKAFAEA